MKNKQLVGRNQKKNTIFNISSHPRHNSLENIVRAKFNTTYIAKLKIIPHNIDKTQNIHIFAL
jgi:hypothetical protein